MSKNETTQILRDAGGNLREICSWASQGVILTSSIRNDMLDAIAAWDKAVLQAKEKGHEAPLE